MMAIYYGIKIGLKKNILIKRLDDWRTTLLYKDLGDLKHAYSSCGCDRSR